MRRASFTPAFKLSVDEPLIVVDETDELDATASQGGSCGGHSSTGGGGGHHHHHHQSAKHNLDKLQTTASPSADLSSSDDEAGESPTNPYLLSPFRDARETRKHSLPNIQITEGIKASQVRRLSDGGENAPTAQEAAFLAQLSQVTMADGDGGTGGAGGDAGGGGAGGAMGGAGGGRIGGCRRHSIVTISKVPPILFGRNRRESFAAFASGGECSDLATNFAKHRGSVHNLQLDIMDGIVQVGKV